METAPTQEMLAAWAAEQLWDWRVRVVFAVLCAIAALACIIIYVAFGRKGAGADGPRTRRWFGRIAVSLLVVAVGEAAFFKDDLTTAIVAATALIVGLIGLRMPQEESSGGTEDASEDGS